MAKADITAQRLRELLHYEPETGHFTRKVRTAQRHRVGDRADLISTTGNLAGYYRVALGGTKYLAHRLAWFYVHGMWPAGEIDHIDADRGNNRIANLRDVPAQMNKENFRRARVDNRSGLLGVSIIGPSSFRASVQVLGKRVHIGVFDTPQNAHAAYIAAKRKLHAGCTL